MEESDLGCFVHTLQLVVNDGILAQRYIQDVLAKCRRIVTYFKHSQLEIQSELGIPHNCFIHNSTRIGGDS